MAPDWEVWHPRCFLIDASLSGDLFCCDSESSDRVVVRVW